MARLLPDLFPIPLADDAQTRKLIHQLLDLRAAEDAAESVARREEQVIYKGVPELGLEGLLTASGRATEVGTTYRA